MTTRFLVLLCGFAACTLLTCGDPATAQPPPNPGTVTWGVGPPPYPQPYDPVGPPMPKSGGISVFGSYAPAAGWMVGPAKCSVAPQAGGVTAEYAVDRVNGSFGYYDPNTAAVIPGKIDLAKGDYNVWVTITFTRIDPVKGTTEAIPVSTAIHKASVK